MNHEPTLPPPPPPPPMMIVPPITTAQIADFTLRYCQTQNIPPDQFKTQFASMFDLLTAADVRLRKVVLSENAESHSR
jgi:hypothetical protein